jgi:hypothetical protein
MHIPFKQWHIPLSLDSISLQQAHESLNTVKASKKGVPLLVRLIENPAYKLPYITLFHGSVSLLQHDYIHFLLGRGLLPKDEAFVIGMTMGSTAKMGKIEAIAYCYISRFLYQPPFRFSKEDCLIFLQAVELAKKMRCLPLDTFPFHDHLDKPLAEVRKIVGIDTEMLKQAYAHEKTTFSNEIESARLLSV